jgi:1-acyl-sn-glycerol-3-phosphate acyltransferase
MLWISMGTAAGALLAGVEGHPSRARGLIPLGVTSLLAVLLWTSVSDRLDWPCLLLGLCAGLAAVPLRAAYQAAVPADARGNGMAVLNTAIYVSTIGLAVVLVALNRFGVATTGTQQLLILAVLAAAGAIVTWWALFRDTLELGLEILFWPIYRIRAHGPGAASFPRRGPLLVLSNHTAYVDPVWLAKVLPRRLTPMMTSDFYDLPGLHFLMTRVVHAIRVESSSYRREAPELNEAIAALDRGQCVLMFPEGWVRRRPEAVVRQFGQGIWHILRRRPDTPVVACWIEGGWGSYTSYSGGPPTVNKRMDLWRSIDVAITHPQVLDPRLLEDQRATRAYLMQLCLDARRYLGLEPVGQPEPAVEEQNDSVTR